MDSSAKSTRSPRTSASTQLEYRKRILQPANSRTVNDLRITSMGLGECLDALQRATHYSERRGQQTRGKGIGLAGSAYISGAGLPIYWNEMPHSGAEIRIDRGGGVTSCAAPPRSGRARTTCSLRSPRRCSE